MLNPIAMWNRFLDKPRSRSEMDAAADLIQMGAKAAKRVLVAAVIVAALFVVIEVAIAFTPGGPAATVVEEGRQ